MPFIFYLTESYKSPLHIRILEVCREARSQGLSRTWGMRWEEAVGFGFAAFPMSTRAKTQFPLPYLSYFARRWESPIRTVFGVKARDGAEFITYCSEQASA